MPILYVHGVATRDSSGFDSIKPFLRRYVAPAISDDPANVLIDKVYWGDFGARFAWEGRSRPRTLLLRQGAPDAAPIRQGDLVETLVANESLRALAAPARVSPQPAPSEYTSGTSDEADATRPVRLSALSEDELSDVLSQLARSTAAAPADAAALAILADDLARDSHFRAGLHAAASPDDEAAFVIASLETAVTGDLLAQGPLWLSRLRDRLSEALTRGGSAPAVAASVVLAEGRPWLNDRISVFIGDVFVYLEGRGTPESPGDIPRHLLDSLEAAWQNKRARGGEPLIVLTHSMGGQLVYDAVTWFLPNDPRRSQITIDFWCATASQVGFFEELKLFGLKDPSITYPAKMPFPEAHVRRWWNVWDHNDVLSFTAGDIFERVDDEPYHTGASLLGAHSAYLTRPSFFRRLAARLAAAADDGRTTP